MSNSCLNKKFKGSMEDSSLLKVGEIECVAVIQSNSSFPTFNFINSTTNEVEITLLDAGVTFSSAVSPSRIIDSKHAVLNLTAGETALYVSGANAGDLVNVHVLYKYDFKFVGRGVDAINLADLKYSTSMITIMPKSESGHVTGKFADINRMSALTRLSLEYQNAVTGDVEELGTLTSINLISLISREQNITGNWENFVLAQRTAGRTMCSNGVTIEVPYYTQVSFGSRNRVDVQNHDESGTLKWDADKISMQFDTSKKVMTIGYTQAEAETAFAGYTVVLCD